jgi:hypothetical protein
MNQTGLRYVGILTHGTQWACYDLVDDKLWSQLLIAALGTQFTDDDDLFIDHTLLVNTLRLLTAFHFRTG